ncbi:SusC/RagA family TonB-linked outer membrane protein [Flavobacterium johnsoniae]|uniref:SusC-like TonB-dependent receptor n=1 Tax=Flavobacterium johnsoniae (strain ATCC 17061 / DSM 2064 / JCM 8514 / BCRC 14874 / CCUG 350202 / NBRC 14942 / NCIMB 11054 / UW101) TaxID=376686 RepID=A5FC08_FLAJ1|nr:TonB-dependent receptor [Flavobacterium johnsoniae]ABQ07263.1 SusC-like TonB-dependent receptor [Flavobacterium johnsoniae UW101]OXE95626.1 SusC/RagA family TonB-linked outer membrane protein [Flavobacterium johnsoniae UW101]WQG80901.1 TonB-dependent receptor [Flavobacterium johnsoniae UW101]SHL18162.1 TonB-linked outer membrane protein, SusC/RagA family [Flavobacterium johnsoniae]
MNIQKSLKKKIKYNLVFLFFLNFLVSHTVSAQSTTIEGKITDAAGLSLPGVNIQEKGTKNGTSTDFEGSFKINVTSNKAVLIISYLGFQTQEVSVAGKTKVNVSLAEQSNSLNEVVVVGYGSVKKTDLTGSVSTISAATITERNTTSALEAIQGSTPGVQISSSSGRSGDGFKVVIRGNNSLVGSSPLYVVDGVPVDNIDFLNPQDISRMDVLKDASSAAIYGSRGASGVIIVTTKSGANVKPGINVTFDSSYGTKTAARMPKMMNGEEWWKFHQVAYMSATPATQTPAQLAALAGNQSPLLVSRANSGYNFDWADAVLKPGMTQNNYLNVTGRSDSGLSYNLGFGIQSDEGLIDNDSTDKYSFKLGLNHKINDKFTTGANITIARLDTELGSDLAMQDAFRLSPLMSPWAVDAQGNEQVGTLFFLPGKLTYPDGSWAINKTSTVNPLMEIANSSQTEKTWQTVGNVFFQYQPLKWLSFKTTFAGGIENTETSASYKAQTNAGVTLNGKNSASIKNFNNFNYTWDNQIDLKHTFNEVHDFSVLLLQSLYSNTDKTSYMYSNNQPFDVGSNNMGSGVQTSYNINSGYQKNTLSSYAVRVNYSFRDKYLLTASTRWDGSSVLSEGNKWQSFPSVALGWKISKESFLASSSVISDLKLRASLGYTGNDNVAPYTSQALLNQQTFYANGANVVSGWQTENLANQALTWEKTRELNFGLDFGFLRNRISGSVDVYDRLSDKLIYKQELPLETGYKNTFANVGSVSNKGVEVLLTTKNIKSEKVNWETTFTFTKNVNKLESIYNQDQVSDIGNKLILGSPLNPNYNYVYDGVWQESQAAEAATYNMLPGQAKPKDLNGDGKFNTDDRTVIGNPNPEWQGSLYSKLTVGNFDFNFSVLTSQGQTVLSTFHQNFADVSDRGRQKLAMDYFIPTNGAGIEANANNTNPRPGPVATGAGAYWTSLFAYYRDVSYVKIKNISLGYTLDSELLKKLKINNLRIYVNVLDPFVFTNFDGYDPEWAASSFGVNRPASITTQLGVSVKF